MLPGLLLLTISEPSIGKICGKLHHGERKALLIRHRSGHSNSTPEGKKEDWVQGCLGKRLRGSTACLVIFFSLSGQEKKKTVRPFISGADTGPCTGRLIHNSQQICVKVDYCPRQQVLTEIPGDAYNGHFNRCSFYKAGCWLRSVWAPLRPSGNRGAGKCER